MLAVLLAAHVLAQTPPAAQPPAALPPDPVLTRAFAWADDLDARRARLSFHLTSRMENLDDDGKVESVDEVTSLVSFAEGAEQRRIVRATLDGREATAREREELTEQDVVRKNFTVASPFLAKHRGRHRFRVTSDDVGAGLARIEFSPAGKNDSHTNVGTAIVDRATGAPVRVELRPSALPMVIQRFEAVIDFDPTPGAVLPKRITTNVRGGVLFIQRRVRSVTTFAVVP